MSERVRRFDRAAIPATKRTAEGYLRVDGSKIARTGIQIYRRADGSEIRELRLPEEVFAQKTLDSFNLVPLTNSHPAKLLDANDAKRFAVGAVGEPRRVDESWIAADISVWDAAAIDSIEQGRTQLSAGYTCEVVEESGEWNGQRYDAKQVNIVANHLALVDVARAGPEARLKLDGADAECVDMPGFGTADIPAYPLKSGEQTNMAHKIKVDGFEFEVSDQNAQTVIDRALAASQKATEAVKADAAGVQAKFDTETAAHADTRKKLDETEKTLADLKAKLDGKMVECDTCGGEGKIDGAKCDECGGEGEYMKDSHYDARVNRAAAKRATLINEAREVLGANEKLDEMTNDAIKVAVVKKLTPAVKVDGKSGEVLDGMYQVALAAQPKKPAAIDQVRTAQAPTLTVVQTNDNDEPDAARRKMQERNRAAFKATK